METIFAKIIYDYLVLKPNGYFQVFTLFNFSEIFVFKSTPSYLKYSFPSFLRFCILFDFPLTS